VRLPYLTILLDQVRQGSDVDDGGLSRTSTVDQLAGLDAQLRDLKAARVEKVFSERVSSTTKRQQLEAALEFCRNGDVLIVTKLDRLARSMADLVSITSKLKAKGVGLRILAMQLDTATPTGKLMLNLMGSFAEFEREIMLERQREGVANAKAAGKYKGRVPTARRQSVEVIKLRHQGIKPEQIATQLGISRASVFRVLKDSRGASLTRPQKRSVRI
jgi:DNA invertase Pin-like site-specific DNA recombinase